MSNLFVCHTQAQLILACGLCHGRFHNDENELILFVDFDLKKEMREKLDRIFSRTLYLQSIYPEKYNTFKAKLKWYVQDWRMIKRYIQNPYKRVFVVCDTLLLVQKCMQLAYRLNQSTRFIWLEDGILAYYENIRVNKGLDRNRFTRCIRKLIFKYFLRVGKFYNRVFPGFGGSSVIHEIYALFPDVVRELYRSTRRITGIDHEEYFFGLQSLYAPSEMSIDKDSIVLIMDKLDTYLHPEAVRKTVKDFIEKKRLSGKTIYCKLHPRETGTWKIFETCQMMDRSIGAESMYLSLSKYKEKISIVGIKSAGLMSAKKLGFDTSSLFLSCGETNANLEHFFKSIHIELIQ